MVALFVTSYSCLMVVLANTTTGDVTQLIRGYFYHQAVARTDECIFYNQNACSQY